jgi:2-polyprenyl-3-methyl-5-hydroxy-6-metoxy-1,4-benzoquinol methylase
VQANTVFEGDVGVARQRTLEQGRHAYFLRHLHRIEKRLGPVGTPRRLLEVGCGSGVLLAAAIARGWQADALELSPGLAAAALAANPGAKVTVADVSRFTAAAADYDAVLALDIIEHVLVPAMMLDNCRGLLKPGGLLLLQTPNTRGLRSRREGADWAMRDPAQHLNLFSPRGLAGLLQRCGFVVVSLETVSGTGLEHGAARIAAAGKQWLLARAGLGNALCVVARRA